MTDQRVVDDSALGLDEDFFAEQARRERERRADQWPKLAPRRFVEASLDDFPPGTPTRELLDEWLVNRSNLVVTGPVGTGKTHAAVAACRVAYVEAGLWFRVEPAVEMLDRLRPGGDEGAWEELTTTGLLCIDDLGVQKQSEWVTERLYAVVNRRWLDCRPTIVTTNLAPKQLEASLDERLLSRLVGDGAVVLRLGGKDRRRASS